MESRLNRYGVSEEIANSITHGIGVILAICALGILITYAAIYGNARHIISVTVYGCTLVLLYTASTLYHSARQPRVKGLFQIMDHSAIYLLIAGTYTPFTLVSLRGPWGWSIFTVIWSLALIGVVFQVVQIKRWPAASLVLYVGMGWVILAAIKPLAASVATGGIVLLFLGGLAYTLGIVFYCWRNLKFHHAVWHLFVLTGSILHFFAIFLHVLPIQN